MRRPEVKYAVHHERGPITWHSTLKAAKRSARIGDVIDRLTKGGGFAHVETKRKKRHR